MGGDGPNQHQGEDGVVNRRPDGQRGAQPQKDADRGEDQERGAGRLDNSSDGHNFYLIDY